MTPAVIRVQIARGSPCEIQNAIRQQQGGPRILTEMVKGQLPVCAARALARHRRGDERWSAKFLHSGGDREGMQVLKICFRSKRRVLHWERENVKRTAVQVKDRRGSDNS